MPRNRPRTQEPERRAGAIVAELRRDTLAMDNIAEMLSGKTWSPDTLDAIATIVRRTGRIILDVYPSPTR